MVFAGRDVTTPCRRYTRTQLQHLIEEHLREYSNHGVILKIQEVLETLCSCVGGLEATVQSSGTRDGPAAFD